MKINFTLERLETFLMLDATFTKDATNNSLSYDFTCFKFCFF